ncbi:MAG: T9SS type A sorting domain-containing protein, partial [Chitinophagales bacterium]|nr:T9SS type A sorting domain-containing protein [Chitinophagales bacterium]
VYKNSSACNSGIHAAHSAAAVSQNNSASSTQSFCIIDDFGEPYMLMATSTGPNCYSLTGTASITGGATEDWPVSGTFCNGFITITATNPNPDGCTSFVDAVNFRWHYTCGKNASTCAMEGGYQQVCFGGIIGEFTLGATVYKNSSACNSGIHAAGSSASVKGSKISISLPVNISVAPSIISNNATITYSLGNAGKVSLSVYNSLGQEIKQLVNGNMAAGNYTINWNAENNNGTSVSKGIYFIVLRADGKVQTATVSKN